MPEQGIPEQDEYDYDTEKIQVPNYSSNGIKNPNNISTDSNIKIFSGNNPLVKKLNLVNAIKNSDEDINFIFKENLNKKNSQQPATIHKPEDIHLEVDKNIKLSKSLKYPNSHIDNNNSHKVESNLRKTIKLQEKKNSSVEFRKNDTDNYNSINNKDMEATKVFQHSNLSEHMIFPSTNINKKNNEENLIEDDIVISGLNDKIPTPNVNIVNSNTHFIQDFSQLKGSENIKSENNDSNNIDNNNLIRKVTFKFNSHNNQAVPTNKIYNNYNSNLSKNMNDNSDSTNYVNNNIYKTMKNINKSISVDGLQNLNIENCLNYESINNSSFKNVKNNLDIQSPYAIKNILQNNKNEFQLEINHENSNVLKRRQSESIPSSSRSKAFDQIKDNDPTINLKRKTSLRQRETIIFNQEDILEFLYFKEWKKKFIHFLKKMKDLILVFSNCLHTVDQSYSWIQKRFLKENLNRIKKSHKASKQKQM